MTFPKHKKKSAENQKNFQMSSDGISPGLEVHGENGAKSQKKKCFFFVCRRFWVNKEPPSNSENIYRRKVLPL